MAEKQSKNPETPASVDSARAVARYLRISPRKLRLVINTVRRKPATLAFQTLMTFKRKGARMTEKVLKSAIANARGLGLDETKLYVSDIRADDGPTMKRFRPRSMGRADRILKRMAHLSIVVKEGKKSYPTPGAGPALQGSQKKGKQKTAKAGA